MGFFPQKTTTIPRTGPFIIKQVAASYAPSGNDAAISLQYLGPGVTPAIQKINTLPFPGQFSMMIAAHPTLGAINIPAAVGDQFQEPDGSLVATLVVNPNEPVILATLDTSASGIWDVIRVNEQASGGALFTANAFRSQGPSESITGFEIASTVDLGALFIHGVTVSGALSGGGISGPVNVSLNAIHGGINTGATSAGQIVVDQYGRVTFVNLNLQIIHGGIFVPGAVATINVDALGRVLAAS